MTSPEVSEAFAILRLQVHADAIELVDVLERRLILAESLVALHERLIAIENQANEPDNYSRKVPDTPVLRLAGAFHCDPDPSCGQDGAA